MLIDPANYSCKFWDVYQGEGGQSHESRRTFLIIELIFRTGETQYFNFGSQIDYVIISELKMKNTPKGARLWSYEPIWNIGNPVLSCKPAMF